MIKFLSEKRLMQKVANQDSKACHTFVNDYMSMMYNVALRVVKNPTMAEDITQEAFTKIWKYAHTFNGESSLKSWIYRITMNTCYDYIKQQNKGGGQYDDIDDVIIEDETDLADTTLFKKEKAEHVQEALYQLSERERSVLVLFYWESAKISEVAHAMDMSDSAVESLLRRTRTKLKNLLDKTIVKA